MKLERKRSKLLLLESLEPRLLFNGALPAALPDVPPEAMGEGTVDIIENSQLPEGSEGLVDDATESTGEGSLGSGSSATDDNSSVLVNDGGIVVEEKVAAATPNIHPMANLQTPSEVMINEIFQITISFDNDSVNSAGRTGYSPFIDVVAEPGMDIQNAFYGNDSLTLQLIGTFDATGQLMNPLNPGVSLSHPLTGAPVTLSGVAAGSQLYSIALPFTSFTPEQPSSEIVLDAKMDQAAGAIAGTPLSIYTRGGFAWGADPLQNPAVDAPLVQGIFDKADITPILLNLKAEVDAPSEGSVTGPNHVRTWTLTIDIAEGQYLNELVLIDLLSDQLVYVGNVSFGGDALTGEEFLLSEPQSFFPKATFHRPVDLGDNEVIVLFGDVVGTASETDLIVTYEAFVGGRDSNRDWVIDRYTGVPSVTSNQATVYQDFWSTPEVLDNASVELKNLPIAIQQTVVDENGGDLVAGDSLLYTFHFQISDYFRFRNAVITTSLSDGQTFDASTEPQFAFYETGSVHRGVESYFRFRYGLREPLYPFEDAFFNVMPQANGETQIQFDMADFLENLDPREGGVWSGYLSRDSILNGATEGSLSYRTFVNEDFVADFASGDSSVDLGDTLTHSVELSAQLWQYENGLPSSGGVPGPQISVTDSVSVELSPLSIVKSIYAVNGATGALPSQVNTGDYVTYRLTLDLPQANVENLSLTNYLPYPLFDASLGMTFDPAMGGIPSLGFATFGPNHTLPLGAPLYPVNGLPTLTIDSANNTLNWDFASFDDPSSSGPFTIDLLFTVEVQSSEYPSGYLVASPTQVTYTTTDLQTLTATDSASIRVTDETPNLTITKGIVATNKGGATFDTGTPGPVPFANPGHSGDSFSSPITEPALAANPINSNLSGIDAGDLVKFALVLQNTGTGNAFDVLLQDTLPKGFDVPATLEGLNLQIRRADAPNLSLTWTDADGNVIPAGQEADALFGVGAYAANPGLRIQDIDWDTRGNLDGSLGFGVNDAGVATTDGSSLLIVTYDLVALSSIVTGSTSSSNAEIKAFSSRDGGSNFVQNTLSDGASITMGISTIQDQQVSSSIPQTGVNQFQSALEDLTIGEQVTYRITLNMAEGTTNSTVVLTDLPFGNGVISYVSSQVISIGGNTNAGDYLGGNLSVTGLGVGDAGTRTWVDANGDGSINPTEAVTINFNFGTVTNTADNLINGSDQIVIEITGRVENLPENQAGDLLTASTTFQFDHGVVHDSLAVELVAPALTLDQSEVGDSLQKLQSGDTFQITLTIGHDLISTAFGFDLQLLSWVDSHFEIISLDSVLGASTARLTDFAIVGAGGGNTIQTIGDIDLGLNEELSLTYTVRVLESAEPNQSLSAHSQLIWTSLNGTPRLGQERTGVEGLKGSGALNDFQLQDTSFFTTESPRFVQVSSVSEDNSLNRGEVNIFNHFYQDQEESSVLDLLEPSPLSLIPIYSGQATPGTTLVITLHSTDGSILGTQTVVADAAGNWLVTFSGLSFQHHPSTLSIEQSQASPSMKTSQFSSTYLSPGAQNEQWIMDTLTVGNVFEQLAGERVEQDYEASLSPFEAEGELDESIEPVHL